MKLLKNFNIQLYTENPNIYLQQQTKQYVKQ